MTLKIAAGPQGAQSGRDLSYREVFLASHGQRMNIIKRGVSARWAKTLFTDLAIGQGPALTALKLSAATVNRKAAKGITLSQEESERVLGMAKLLGQVESMVEESGGPEGFDAGGWLSEWLRTPLPAFGGDRPIDYMDTMEGQTLVANTLLMMQSGAYA